MGRVDGSLKEQTEATRARYDLIDEDVLALAVEFIEQNANGDDWLEFLETAGQRIKTGGADTAGDPE